MIRSILELYYKNLEDNRSSVAVTDTFDELTYDELERASNQLCNHMISSGVKQGSLIPICIEDALERTVAILAVVKCNAGFILIDSQKISERLELLKKHTENRIYVTSMELESLCPEGWTSVTADDAFTCQDEADTDYSDSENLIACAHFTSGSTGTPKLVFVQQFDVCDTVRAKNSIMQKHGVKKTAQYLSEYFAFGSETYLTALLTGKTLYYAPHIDRGNIIAWFSFIEKNKIDMVELPASLINTIGNQNLILEQIPDCLMVMMTGGEALHPTSKLKNTLKSKEIHLYAEYGCSEMLTLYICDVFASEHRKNGKVPLGAPVEGCLPVVRDNRLYIQRKGKKEADYDHRRLETADWVCEGDITDGFLWDSKDIVECTDDETYIVGRFNRCVKIRGYRVNLTEIEFVLKKKYPQGEFYAGCVEGNNHVNKIGLIYTDTGNDDEAALKDFLRTVLDDHKLPQIYVKAGFLPRNKNGKADFEKCMALLNGRVEAITREGENISIEDIVSECIFKFTGPLNKDYAEKTFSDLDIDSLAFMVILCEIESKTKIPLKIQEMDFKWLDTPEKLIMYICMKISDKN